MTVTLSDRTVPAPRPVAASAASGGHSGVQDQCGKVGRELNSMFRDGRFRLDQ